MRACMGKFSASSVPVSGWYVTTASTTVGSMYSMIPQFRNTLTESIRRVRQDGEQAAKRQLSTITTMLEMATCQVRATGDRGELSPLPTTFLETSAVP
jgi:hypothetical protein